MKTVRQFCLLLMNVGLMLVVFSPMAGSAHQLWVLLGGLVLTGIAAWVHHRAPKDQKASQEADKA